LLCVARHLSFSTRPSASVDVQPRRPAASPSVIEATELFVVLVCVKSGKDSSRRPAHYTQRTGTRRSQTMHSAPCTLRQNAASDTRRSLARKAGCGRGRGTRHRAPGQEQLKIHPHKQCPPAVKRIPAHALTTLHHKRPGQNECSGVHVTAQVPAGHQGINDKR